MEDEKVEKNGSKSISMVRARAISVYLGGALLIACAVLMMMRDTLGDILWLEVMLGLGLFLGGMSEFLGLRKPLKDERAARIGTLATTYSWYTTLLLAATIVMIFGFGGGHKVSMTQAVGAILITMVVSSLVFNWYLGRKGDVE